MNDERSVYLSYAQALKHPNDFASTVDRFFNKDAVINIVHPFNEMKGSKDYLEFFLLPAKVHLVDFIDEMIFLCLVSLKVKDGLVQQATTLANLQKNGLV